MYVNSMKLLVVKFKNGKGKAHIFDTEEKALECYNKWKNHHLVEEISLHYTNALKKIKIQ